MSHPRRYSSSGQFVLALALLGSACIKVEIEGSLPDGGTSSTGIGGSGPGTGGSGGGGVGGGLVPKFEGGRHPATWRAGMSPITEDVPRWYVPKTAGRYRYPGERTQSPIPPAIAEHLRNLALHGTGLADNVFMKVGDSISDSQNYLGCFKGDINNRAPTYEFNIVLGGHEDLAEAIFHFRSAKIGETSPFDRESKCTKVGAAVTWPLEGDAPTPLEQEFTAVSPQFAGIMYGTNDLGLGGSATIALDVKVRPYQKGLVTLVDTMLARGVVPWLSTIPPRTDDLDYMKIVPVFNAIIRSVAEGRQIPLVDFNRDLLGVTRYGLGGDGVHPTTQEYNTACHLDMPSMAYGYNVRNLGALTVLDRLMKVVVEGAASLDDTAPQLAGEGNAASPFVIDALPFSDMRSTVDARETALEAYSCVGAKGAPGAEYVYRLDLAAPTALRAVVLDGSTNHAAGDTAVDVDVYLLDDSRAATGCIASGDAVLQTMVGPGTFYVVVDTTAAGPEVAGEFTLAVVECEASDSLCVRTANGERARH
ncbi:MAG TPA: SGNH/GDSL hydrolase family protein [Polyangiaceae bacterium]|nr:SGNH/GDSL hydrolase family protein [Polyangiaceae bacterium]